MVPRVISLVPWVAQCVLAAGDDEDDKGGKFAHFNMLFFLVLFTVAVWIAGKAAASTGMPSLVGEIAAGVVLGPHVANFVPFAGSLQVVGEIGLILLIVEAGLHVDLEMLQLIGARGLAVGLLGSILPMTLAFAMATAWGASPVEAFAVGACMATMSTGIALNVMKGGGVLNQPIGQLIIAAATVNEICNIVLITEVSNVVNGVAIEWYAIPIGIMFVLVGVVGYAAVHIVPTLLDKHVLPRVPADQRANVVLGLIFVTALALIPGCKYSGGSELLGAFLAGFCFCADHVVHETWNKQVKRVMAWLLKFFFACTIGFEIPVGHFGNVATLARAGLLFLCITGKLAMGFFAVPLTVDNFWILSFAWSEWGEFSFLIATIAANGILNATTYDAVVLAVAASIVVCPYGLRFTLDRVAARARQDIARAVGDTADVDSGALHATYFCLQTKSHAHWDQTTHLLKALRAVDLDVIDFRSHHPNDHFGVAHCVNEAYVRDVGLRLPATRDLPPPDEARLGARIADVLKALKCALPDGEGTEVRVQRWMPGAHLDGGVLRANDDAKLRTRDRRPSLSLLPRSPDGRLQGEGAGKWHHLALDRAGSTSCTTNGRAPSNNNLSLADALDVRPQHELDGFVHTDAHRPFSLPDNADREMSSRLLNGRAVAGVHGANVIALDVIHDDDDARGDDSFAQSSPRLSRVTSRMQGLIVAN